MESSLVEHVGRGERLDLTTDGEALDEAAMLSWSESQTCRASVIRDILRGRLAADPDPHGLRLRGARITGRLDLESLTTDVNLELTDCLLNEGVLAQDAHLACVFLVGCQIEHSDEPAIDGARLTCSVLNMTRASVIGHAKVGAVNLTGAHIGGLVIHTKAELRNDSGPALNAHSLQVDQSVSLGGEFIGSGSAGTVNLLGARIGGDFRCFGTKLRNNSGPALFAEGLQVDQFMFLRDGFTAIGAGEMGAVRLSGARIGLLDCTRADLRNDSGPALYTDGLQVDQSMFLCSRFTSRGADGAVRLSGARIGGGLTYAGAELRNDFGPALKAVSLHVGQALYFTGAFTGGGEDVAVDLTGAQIDGAFEFDPKRLEHRGDSHQRLAVDGLTYTGVPRQISPEDWRELLRQGTPGYAAQPYQQLAAGCRARGDDRQARQTLMTQRDDLLARTHPRWPDRLWAKITKVTLGYGYQPWRALWFLAAVVAVSCVLAVALGAHGALAQTSKTATPGRSCTVMQQVSVGLDLNLPVGTSVARAACDLTTNSSSVTAAWLTAVGWVLRVLAWVFAALFIAGFTGAVRKT